MINLRAGADTVYLGSANETVNGGSGVASIYAASATIGATISGLSGTGSVYLQVVDPIFRAWRTPQ